METDVEIILNSTRLGEGSIWHESDQSVGNGAYSVASLKNHVWLHILCLFYVGRSRERGSAEAYRGSKVNMLIPYSITDCHRLPLSPPWPRRLSEGYQDRI